MDEKSRKQQAIVKICCVIAAFGLWLYITSVMNPIKTYKKNIPVTIVNEEGLEQFKLSLLPDQKPYVSLTLRGSINDIYSITEEQFKVVVDLNAYVLKKGENNIPVQIQSSPDNINIMNSDNLWATVSLDDLIEKTVPLRINTLGNVKEGYYPLDVTSSIKEVTVKGAAKFVNSVDRGEVKCDLSNAYRDISMVLPIEALDKDGNVVNHVNIKPVATEIKVPIRRVKTVNVNVKTSGQLGEDKLLDKIAVTPEKVDITGDENILNSIDYLDTENIDLSSITGNEVTAKLILPKGVELVKKDTVVKVKIYSNAIIDKEVSLAIKTMNLESNHTMEMDKDKITIVISGLHDVINNIKSEDIECYVDLLSLKEGQHNLPVKVNLPSGLNIISINPNTINVTIKSTQEEENKEEDKKDPEVQNAN
ncbi:CdaR family protein [uncultured Clostridium sp.]|uniref:CdaR family protein n=1 Tax=uncultured Clostridium sp. TaxID=59620 RepID=UPI0028EA6288|nr:CdaR family protein [uncultured Clostridium sp.]